jgi:putative SOS response-associated peptidase YedK
MINARAETVADKNAFKSSLRRRRCIIPADGFYEWQKIPGQKKKQPMFISRPDGEPLAFAGLWSVWRDQEGDELHSCTIITTSANEDMEPVHDRMPVILGAGDWGPWLDRDNDDLDTLGKLLVPAPPRLVQLRPVSTEVNNVRNKGPHLIEPVEIGDGPDQGTLPGGDAGSPSGS